MAKSARARSTCAAGALSERLRRVKAIRSSGVSGRRGSFRWRDMGHLGARGSSHHYTRARGKWPTSANVPAENKQVGRVAGKTVGGWRLHHVAGAAAAHETPSLGPIGAVPALPI